MKRFDRREQSSAVLERGTPKARKEQARGRPRAFDIDRALDRALQVFWRQGYEGTSLSDLTKAIGINRPSLYAAFGNKEELFRKVLDRYAEGPSSRVSQALSEPTAYGAVKRLLYASAELQTSPRNPRGCLTVHGALTCSPENETIRRELASRRLAAGNDLLKRLEQGKSEGELRDSADPTELARYFIVVIQGMAVQAASGATRQQLEKVADLALLIWPREAASPSRSQGKQNRKRSFGASKQRPGARAAR
jgi:AcrR family transcriptional regulator